ncbi:MAG: SRPBCC family protein [Myxococcota bacterium]
MNRTAIATAVVLALGGLAAFVWTQSLPENHKVSRSGRYQKTTKESWALVSDLEHAAEWRTDLEKIERMPDVRGHAVWRETYRDGEVVTLETVETIDGRRLVRCVIDTDLPFGGCWTVEVSPRDKVDSVVTITESLRVKSLPWRLTNTAAGRKKRLDRQLLAIGEKFGQTPKLADVARDLNTPRPKKQE